MLKKLYIIVLTAFLSTLCAGPGEALSAAELFKRYSPSVATLHVIKKNGQEGQGTGFLVSSSGEILTNYHVVDNADAVTVYFSEQLWYSAKRIVAQDPEKDLALVWIERISPSIPYLGLSPARIPEGSDLVVIGTPRGLEKTISTGIVSGYRSVGNMSLVQITAPISPGSSGSPVFDINGKVIGIAIAGIKDSQGLNFAVEAKEISAFLRTRPFKAPAAASGGKPANSAKAPLQTRQSAQPLSFPEILTQLDLARPQLTASQVVQNFGEPLQTEKRGENYYLRLWDFKQNRAALFVWERDGQVQRSEWVEQYSTKEEATERTQAMLALAGQHFGKPNATSQSGRSWKRGNYTVGIEQHSVKNSHMVMFKATR